MVTEIGDRHPQDVLDDAPRNETVVAGSGQTTLDAPITVTTPGITLRGVDLRVADGTDGNAVEIGADGVRLTDFRIDGNRGNQPGERQSSGIVVTGASGVAVENGLIRETSRHGVLVVDTATTTAAQTIEGNVTAVAEGTTDDVTVRNLRVESPRRDGCSVEGPEVENVRVAGVRTVDSEDRGGVEIKDGTTETIVTNCHAEDCRYGVAVQDHGTYGVENVIIATNTAVGCDTAVDAQNALRHGAVAVVGNTGRELTGEGMGGPGGIYMEHLDGVTVANNLLQGVDSRGIVVEDCTDATVTDNVLREVRDGPGIDILDTPGALVEGNTVSGGGGDGIRCRGADAGADLLVATNRCADNQCAGIRLTGEDGIEHALVSSNLVCDNGTGGVVDETGGGTVALTDNLE